MKKLLSLILVLSLMAALLVGCGGSSESADKVKVIDIKLTEEEYAFGVDKNQPELLAEVNAFIAKILSDGTFEAICNKYFADGEPTAVTSAELDESKDQLVVATNAMFEPFEYTAGGKFYGIDYSNNTVKYASAVAGVATVKIDDAKLAALGKVFAELIEDTDIEY